MRYTLSILMVLVQPTFSLFSQEFNHQVKLKTCVQNVGGRCTWASVGSLVLHNHNEPKRAADLSEVAMRHHEGGTYTQASEFLKNNSMVYDLRTIPMNTPNRFDAIYYACQGGFGCMATIKQTSAGKHEYHSVVVVGLSSYYVFVRDPNTPNQTTTVPWKEFDAQWTGPLLTVYPSAELKLKWALSP